MQLENVIAVYNLLAVCFKAGNWPHDGTGGDDDVFGLKCLLFSFDVGDFHLARQRELARALKDGDLVLLHQILDALRVLQHDFIFSLLHVGKGQLNL